MLSIELFITWGRILLICHLRDRDYTLTKGKRGWKSNYLVFVITAANRATGVKCCATSGTPVISSWRLAIADLIIWKSGYGLKVKQ